MKKLIRQYQLEIRGMNDDKGIIEGVGSATEVYIEGYHEVVSKGAFKKTIQETGGHISVFKAHNPDIELGTTLNLWEDNVGLGFEMEMLINDVQAASEEWALMKQKFNLGVKRGISMGFMAIKEGVRKQFNGFRDVRDLLEVRLFELSPTPFPANTKAGLTQMRYVEFVPERSTQISDNEPDILHSINEALKHSINTINSRSIS